MVPEVEGVGAEVLGFWPCPDVRLAAPFPASACGSRWGSLQLAISPALVT